MKYGAPMPTSAMAASATSGCEGSKGKSRPSSASPSSARRPPGETLAEALRGWRPDGPYTYGIYGTPTTRKLAARIAELEGARHTFIVPSGQSAIALIYLVYCKAGTHALMPESAYGNSREIADDLLADLDVEVESYDPMIGTREQYPLEDQQQIDSLGAHHTDPSIYDWQPQPGSPKDFEHRNP